MHNLVLFLFVIQGIDLGAVRGIAKMVLGIYVVWHEGADSTDPEDVGIVIEGCTVLQDLGDLANGCAVLLGLIYSLNLSYPKDLRYTFEFLQKVLMELDGFFCFFIFFVFFAAEWQL